MKNGAENRRFDRLPHGVDARVVLRRAKDLGVWVRPVRCTGEVRLSHPLMDRPACISHPTRRKDSTRDLVSWFNRLVDLLNAGLSTN